MVSQPAVSETIVFTLVIFKKHHASQLKTLFLESRFHGKNLNTNA